MEVRSALGIGDRRCQDFPVGRIVGDAGWNLCVAVAWVPVHRDAEDNGNVDQCDVVDADVLCPAAASVGRLEEDTDAYMADAREVVCLDVAEATGGFAANGDNGSTVPHDGITKDDVFGGAVDSEAIGVATSFEAERIVVDCNVGVPDEDVGGGVDVDAVGGGAAAAFVVADSDAIDGNVGGVDDVD